MEKDKTMKYKESSWDLVLGILIFIFLIASIVIIVIGRN